MKEELPRFDKETYKYRISGRTYKVAMETYRDPRREDAWAVEGTLYSKLFRLIPIERKNKTVGVFGKSLTRDEVIETRKSVREELVTYAQRREGEDL